VSPRPDDLIVLPAEHSGTCPLCTRWIRAGRSKVAPLPVGLCLVPDEHVYHNGRHWRSSVTPDGVPMYPESPRDWGHAACVRRYLRRTEGQDHGDIADARRDALREHKAAAIRAHEVHFAPSRRAGEASCDRNTEARREGGS
jgi:hypothetical protein